RRVLLVNSFAEPVRLHPRADGNVRFVDEFETADERIKRLQQLGLRELRRARQPFLVLEQLHKKKTRAEKLKMPAWPNPPAQITPCGVQAFEGNVCVNDDAIRVHRSDGGMNFSLLATHQSPLDSSARWSASF